MENSFAFKCIVNSNNHIEYFFPEDYDDNFTYLIEDKVCEAFADHQVGCLINIDDNAMHLTLIPIKVEGIVVEVVGTIINCNSIINQQLSEDLRIINEFKQTMQLLPNIIFKAQINNNGQIFKLFNEGALVRELSMTTGSITGKTIEEIYPKELSDIMIPAFKRAFAGETVQFLSEYQGRAFNNVVKPSGTRDCQIVGCITEVTEQKLAEKSLMHYINHDQLTGLPNRVLFHDRLTQAIIHAETNHQKLALLMFDLDRFKLINDSLGHAIGDMMLKAVANRIVKSVSKIATVARISGDGFAIVLENISNEEEARVVASDIIQFLSRPFLIKGHELYISSSVGISIYPNDGIDIDMLIKRADIALHQAKDQGSNTYQKYRYAMNSKNEKRLKLESDLRRAIERDEFEVFYQPQTEASTGEVVGMEALVRWNHPELGRVAPMEFIPVAEETGMIIAIGEWVLRQACTQTKAWQNKGYEPIKISVNLSPKQFQQENLVQIVANILEEVQLDASYLVLEITESISMNNIDFVIKTLEELNALGIQVSIDDFGTGYSSLLYLKKFPIQSLKIDRSFIHDITDESDDAAIALAVIAMAHSLNLTVIAEGVETVEQLKYLKKHRCDNFQGFLLGKPVPANEFEQCFMKKTI